MVRIYGPYSRPDGRKHICFYNQLTGRKTSKSYARYLMEQKLDRELNKNEHVDHIDNDFTNDDIENLQVLSASENNKKAFKFYGKEAIYITRICEFCTMHFARRQSVYTNKSNVVFFCTENCRAQYYGNLIRLGLMNNQPLWRNANASDLRSDTERFVGSTPARGTSLDENQ